MANYLNGFGLWFQDQVHLWMNNKGPSYVPGASKWCGLATDASTPLPDGTNFTEPTVGGYAREEVSNDDWNLPERPSPYLTETTNNDSIEFVEATDPGWGTIIAFGFFTESSSTQTDKLIWGGFLTEAKVIDSGVAPLFPIENVKLISGNKDVI